MMSLHEIMKQRRDTRHFTTDEVPQEVLDKAILAGHFAPSVGLTNATRFYIVRKAEIKSEIKKTIESKSVDLSVQYIAITDNEMLDEISDLEYFNGEVLISLAVYCGKTRLIDNVVFEKRVNR